MSYDVEFFQLAEGVTLEEVNAYLQSDAYREYLGISEDDEACECGHDDGCDCGDADEESSADEGCCEEGECSCCRGEEEFEDPLLPERFVNTQLSEEDLRMILQKPLLEAFVPEEDRTPDLVAFLNSDSSQIPERWEEELDNLLEYSGDPGTQPFCFGYGEELYETMGRMVKMLERLESQRIALFDPQMSQVVMGSAAAAALAESVEQSNAFYQDVMSRFQNGEEEEEDSNS